MSNKKIKELKISKKNHKLDHTKDIKINLKDDLVDFSQASQLNFSDLKDNTKCSFSLELRVQVIEAVLFISDKPVKISTLLTAFGEEGSIQKAHIKEALEVLEKNLRETKRSFRLYFIDGGYQLRTIKDLKKFLQNTIKARSFRLTSPSLETLAIVAYTQPCSKFQVDEVRGVDSSHLIRTLMDKSLLAFAGKSELPGKPMLYKTTSKFLEIFGLKNIKELPSLSEIETLFPNGIDNENSEEKETLSNLTGKLKKPYDESYSASEKEFLQIHEQLSKISTKTEFFEEEKQKQKAKNLREVLITGGEISSKDQNWLIKFDEKIKTSTTSEPKNEITKKNSISKKLLLLSKDNKTLSINNEEIKEEEVKLKNSFKKPFSKTDI